MIKRTIWVTIETLAGLATLFGTVSFMLTL